MFLATHDDALLRAAGLIELWLTGYVEPVEPPALPLHVLTQQLMALTLQEGGIGQSTWFEWVRRVPAFAELPADQVTQIVQWMLDHQLLWSEVGILAIGRGGEERYGRRHFRELLSVFLSPPLFQVLCGRQELGYVDDLTFLGKQDAPRVLLLGGRSWRVSHLDWPRRVAYVVPSEHRGRSRWKGQGAGLSFALCQAIKQLLESGTTREFWSRRANERWQGLQAEFSWLVRGATVAVRSSSDTLEWWTFAGKLANAGLAAGLTGLPQCRVSSDDFAITFEGPLTILEFEEALSRLRAVDPTKLIPEIEDAALGGLKFAECLPPGIAVEILRRRTCDMRGIEGARRQPARMQVSQGHPDGPGP